jgi:glycosyltransferase involved in cell wall biosynthesis
VSERQVIALLGRRDEPTDAVEEYCRYLGEALRERGYEVDLARVAWKESGWRAALQELAKSARAWRGSWVLVQYTALAWSARGFPSRSLRVLEQIRQAGARVGVVFHDAEPYGGKRVIDAARRREQLRVMRRAFEEADLAIFTLPLHLISWLDRPYPKAAFIPVGANLPIRESEVQPRPAKTDSLRIAVFGITGGETGRKECEKIAAAIRPDVAGGIRLQVHVFGRGASETEARLREALRDVQVDLRVDGVIPAEEVLKALTASDVALYVRGPISSSRGSAIAGIACGLPVVAYAGKETAAPVTDAGVLLVSREREGELGEQLLRVLSDANLRRELAERSRKAQREHFSWSAIADRYVEALNKKH